MSNTKIHRHCQRVAATQPQLIILIRITGIHYSCPVAGEGSSLDKLGVVLESVGGLRHVTMLAKKKLAILEFWFIAELLHEAKRTDSARSASHYTMNITAWKHYLGYLANFKLF